MTTETLQYHRVCALSDLPEGTVKMVMVGDVPVAVVNSGGRIYAIYDECSHQQVALSEGDVEDGTIECCMHGSRFDLTTGKPIEPPATEPVPIYLTKIEGDDVFVAVS